VQLAVAINQQIEARNLSQIAVADLLSINQPKVSARIRKPKRASNRAGRISVESASSIRNRKPRFDGHRIAIDRT